MAHIGPTPGVCLTEVSVKRELTVLQSLFCTLVYIHVSQNGNMLDVDPFCRVSAWLHMFRQTNFEC